VSYSTVGAVDVPVDWAGASPVLAAGCATSRLTTRYTAPVLKQKTHTVLRLAASAALVFALAACSSQPPKPATNAGQGNASPQFFDFTKQPEAKEGEPADPKTCKHVWVAKGTRPYQTIVNGMPMVRMGYIHRCARCGLIQAETKRVLGGRSSRR